MAYSDDQVQLARTVVGVPEVDKWSKEALAGIRSTPWDLHTPRKIEMIFKDKIEKEHGQHVDKIILARQP